MIEFVPLATRLDTRNEREDVTETGNLKKASQLKFVSFINI